jgi:hypothetical protein
MLIYSTSHNVQEHIDANNEIPFREMAEFYKELADKTVTDIMNGKPDRLGNATKLRLLSRLLRHVSENGVANIEQLHYMDAVSWNLLSDDEQSRVSRAYRQPWYHLYPIESRCAFTIGRFVREQYKKFK